MILGNRDKRTRELAGGERTKAFEGFAHRAEMKLDQLEAATSMALAERDESLDRWLH